MSGVQKAIAEAKRNLVTVPIFEDTIPHAVSYKFKASKVFLLPAPEGKGVIAGGAVRKVLELAGIKNVLSKMHGSRNKLNSVYATMECLKALQNRAPIKTKSEDTESPETDVPEKEVKAEKKAPAAKVAPKKKDAYGASR
jgi:small subunit ribosomal protein S5